MVEVTEQITFVFKSIFTYRNNNNVVNNIRTSILERERERERRFLYQLFGRYSYSLVLETKPMNIS